MEILVIPDLHGRIIEDGEDSRLSFDEALDRLIVFGIWIRFAFCQEVRSEQDEKMSRFDPRSISGFGRFLMK